MRLIYSISLRFYYLLMWLVSPFYKRARLWQKNRSGWSAVLEKLNPQKKTVWIHAASAGEFEQAIPLIRHIRNSNYDLQVVVSFYSASGYELYKDSELADIFFHFPPDYRRNAKKIIGKIKPVAVIFIRNEIWWNTLSELHKENIPALLINAEPQKRAGIYGRYLANCYKLFSKIYYTHIIGNTKAERVTAVEATEYKDAVMEEFSASAFVLMLGSCYDKEMGIAAKFYKANHSAHPGLKIVFCPHAWNEKTISHYQEHFEEPIHLYTDVSSPGRLVFVDKMGILKYLYRYASAAIVGGGFGKGVHNVSEAAAYGIPVFIGPNYEKFPEVKRMVENGTVFVTENENQFSEKLLPFMQDKKLSESIKEKRKQTKGEAGFTSVIIWKEIESKL